jgi:DNA-directed RNA polymerase subunit RPC12/RpoP
MARYPIAGKGYSLPYLKEIYFRSAQIRFIYASNYLTIMSEGLAVNCRHCGYTWQYKGNSEYYCTCPRCLSKVPVKGYKSEAKTGI